jgi:hypothetical protein
MDEIDQKLIDTQKLIKMKLNDDENDGIGSVNGRSGLTQIKHVMKTLKEEIKEMNLRTGLVSQQLLIKQVLFHKQEHQKKIRYRTIK